MQGNRASRVLAAAAIAVAVAGPVHAGETLSEDRIDALIEVLRERGVIESEDAQAILERNAAYEKKRSWLSRLSFSGDLRGRYEKFWNQDRRNRERLRYRLRFGARAEVNDHLDVAFRLASGQLSNSRNQTLGSGLDFDPDGIYIDEAFLAIRPFGRDAVPIPTAKSLRVLFGKMPNPFNSKKLGKDLILWDGDHTPEGVAASLALAPCDCLDLNLDVAYFVIDENSGGADEDMVAVQLEKRLALAEHVVATGALSYYHLDDLGSDFFDRVQTRTNNSSFYGNTVGLSKDMEQIDLIDYRATLAFDGIESVPILAYGRFVRNLSATRPGAGFAKQDTAWSAGLELGDKKRNVRVGAGYFHVEADAVPSSLTDSDLFDGHTNAKGWAIYAKRQVWAQTDFGVTVFVGDAIDRALAGGNLSRFDRVRMQGDIQVKF